MKFCTSENFPLYGMYIVVHIHVHLVYPTVGLLMYYVAYIITCTSVLLFTVGKWSLST